jgi:hypothetical protein
LKIQEAQTKNKNFVKKDVTNVRVNNVKEYLLTYKKNILTNENINNIKKWVNYPVAVYKVGPLHNIVFYDEINKKFTFRYSDGNNGCEIDVKQINNNEKTATIKDKIIDDDGDISSVVFEENQIKKLVPKYEFNGTTLGTISSLFTFSKKPNGANGANGAKGGRITRNKRKSPSRYSKRKRN